MAGENAYNLSMTPGDNVTIGGSGAAGTSVPSQMDNSLRALGSFFPEVLRDIGGEVTAGGSANALSITPNSGDITLFDGLPIACKVATDNDSTTVTLNAGSSGAEPVKKAVEGVETALAVGDLKAGEVAIFRWRSAWDSTNGAWELVNPNIKLTLRNLVSDLGGSTTAGGTADALTISPAGGDIPALTEGLLIGCEAASDNTSATVTLNAGGTGAEPVKKAVAGVETDPVVGDLKAGAYAVFRWRADWDSAGGAWELVNPYSLSKGGWTETYAATTSGDESLFTGIPASATDIEIFFNNVSLSGTEDVVVQLGDAGGYESTGYSSFNGQILDGATSDVDSNSNGFHIKIGADTRIAAGKMTIKNVTGNTWVMDFTAGNYSSGVAVGGGSKTLSETLNSIRIFCAGSDTFDAGGVLVRYR